MQSVAAARPVDINSPAESRPADGSVSAFMNAAHAPTGGFVPQTRRSSMECLGPGRVWSRSIHPHFRRNKQLRPPVRRYAAAIVTGFRRTLHGKPLIAIKPMLDQASRREQHPALSTASGVYFLLALTRKVMANHYVYRIDRDLGFAPHVSGRLCTLCGCKTTTIERWARPGSWVVGIGGNGTGRANMLIYAMQVTSTPSYGEFQTSHPRAALYLRGHGVSQDAPVLVSNHFYYFGSSAPPISSQLKHIIHPTQGCKRLSAQDLAVLHALVLSQYTLGCHGSPNNKVSAPSCGGCER